MRGAWLRLVKLLLVGLCCSAFLLIGDLSPTSLFSHRPPSAFPDLNLLVNSTSLHPVTDAAWLNATEEPILPDEGLSRTSHFESLNFTSHGNFCVVSGAQRADSAPPSGLSGVTLCTQASLNYLPFVVAQAERWDGPVSAALFLPHAGWLPVALRALTAARRCRQAFAQRVSAVLFFPQEGGCLEEPSPEPVEQGDCLEDCEALEDCASSLDLSPFDFSFYPRNVGRNLAKAAAATPLVLVADVELQPSAAFVPRFLEFFHRWRRQSGRGKVDWANEEEIRRDVFVVPAFEANVSLAEVPRSPRALGRLLAAGEAVVFHSAFCWECHRFAGWQLWIHRLSARSSSKAQILRTVRWHVSWEPVFVGWRRGPDWDERFTGAGYNKIQQAFLLCVLGVRFHVMEGVFVAHPGIAASRPHSPNSTDVSRNAALFRAFRGEVHRLQPNGRQCESWNMHAP